MLIALIPQREKTENMKKVSSTFLSTEIKQTQVSVISHSEPKKSAFSEVKTSSEKREGKYNNRINKSDIKLLKKVSDNEDFESALKGVVQFSRGNNEKKLSKQKYFILFEDKFVYYKKTLGVRMNVKYIDLENIHASFHASVRSIFLIWDERPIHLTFDDNETFQDVCNKMKPYCFQFNFEERYEILDYFSTRKHSKVVKIWDKRSKMKFAAKIYSKSMWLQRTEEIMHLVEKELSFFRKLEGKYSPKIYEIFDSKETVSIVMEIMRYGTLQDMLKNYEEAAKFMNEEYIKEFTSNTLKGLLYCEYKGVVLREINPSTILFSNKAKTEVKFIVSSASIFSEEDENAAPKMKKKIKIVNKQFTAPEVFEGLAIDNKCDIYSLGAVLLQMVTGKEPSFFFENNRSHLKDFDYWAHKISPKGREMIMSMLEIEPGNRPNFTDALRNDWFNEILGENYDNPEDISTKGDIQISVARLINEMKSNYKSLEEIKPSNF